jgi:hypothetical protein
MKVMKMMLAYVILYVKMDIKVLDLYVGKIVHQDFLTLEQIA